MSTWPSQRSYKGQARIMCLKLSSLRTVLNKDIALVDDDFVSFDVNDGDLRNPKPSGDVATWLSQ